MPMAAELETGKAEKTKGSAKAEGGNVATAKPAVQWQGLTPAQRAYLPFKRFLDIVLSLIGIALISVFVPIIAIVVKIDSKGPAFIRHERIGVGGKPIMIHKFRTMVSNADELFKNFTAEQKKEFEKNYKLDNDPRVTRVGKYLRKSSLDEIPQLVDVLFGDLSLVGPRPVVEGEIEKYGTQKSLFLSVQPGLTGYWQINGRNCISYDERIELELYYARNVTPWLDVKILFMTIPAVIFKIGAK